LRERDEPKHERELHSLFSPVQLIVVANSIFHFAYDDILNMPYITLIKMIMESNFMNTPEKDKKKSGSIMDFANMMNK
jgi:hypothetical protein